MTKDPLAPIRKRFRERALADADALAGALAAGDAVQIEALAHGLAGAAGIFGFTEISDRAKALDARFAEGRPLSPPEVEALIRLIRREMT
ncbi:Hpt domain-containing protein [Brevundimonas sp. FT23042]|uniref:Hpt domain-containing protein n=1 Tax=Brevundimonas sp. FT23042 TaxID=3393749 RepID=UPI003B58723A